MQIYLPIAELPISVLLVLVMSAAVGFISGLFGIGGGFLLTPLLIFQGIPAGVAVATVTAHIAASSMTGALGYWRRRSLDFKLAGVLIAGGLVGTVLGVLAFNALQRAGQLEVTITLAYLVLFMIVGSLMLYESLRSYLVSRKGAASPYLRRAGQHPAWLGLPLRMRFHRSKLYASVLPIGGFAAAVGFLGAILGIGGGFIMVPAMIYLFRIPTSVVVGTSLLQILATMVAAAMFHAITNQLVDIVLAALLIVGGVFGAQFGARAARNIKGEVFRLLLALLIVGVGLRFAGEAMIRPAELFSINNLGPGL